MKKTIIVLFIMYFQLIVGYAEDKGYVLSNSIWPTKNISVCWENFSDSTLIHRNWVKEAITNSWQANSALVFSGWENQCTANSNGIRIRVDETGPHVKALGKYLDGLRDGMVLNFTYNNWSTSCKNKLKYCTQSIAVHEFGHALGFAHEQNRPDTPSSCKDSPQGTNGDIIVGNWDLYSVMNYCNPKYNGDGKLSVTDKYMVNLFYSRDKEEYIITNFFNGFLRRPPKEEGKNYWKQELLNNGCSKQTLQNIMRSFILSSEFEQGVSTYATPSIEIVERLFLGILNRPVAQGGLIYWSNRISNDGLSAVDVANGIFGSPEFAQNVSNLCR